MPKDAQTADLVDSLWWRHSLSYVKTTCSFLRHEINPTSLPVADLLSGFSAWLDEEDQRHRLMSPTDTLESNPHNHQIKTWIVTLDSLEIIFLSCSFPLFTPLLPMDLFFQANAEGTLVNNTVTLSGRLIRSQYGRLVAASPNSALARGGPMNVP